MLNAWRILSKSGLPLPLIKIAKSLLTEVCFITDDAWTHFYNLSPHPIHVCDSRGSEPHLVSLRRTNDLLGIDQLLWLAI